MRIKPQAVHAVLFMTTPYVFFPVGPGWVDAAKGNQHAVAVCSTFLGELAVDQIEPLLDHRLEAAGPGFRDPVFFSTWRPGPACGRT